MFKFEKAKNKVDFTVLKEGQSLKAKMSGFKFRQGHCIACFEDSDSTFDAYLGQGLTMDDAMKVKGTVVTVVFNGMTDDGNFARCEVIQ